ncbi:hypothetical protein [Defluviimonas salinarum]|uniref:VapC45 PIN like domain-containing protein n=1 Tax=Defluviimonas salinarum TaxID=2992147 RepID=A0ABT3J9Q9_9RHOB|nr:hypothetical protein [Defluviimonas salinarum]MCW3784195.1 hypothetical protein [Defluviimonas salinarum]
MVDENLPPAMARALAALFVGEHQVVHLRERFGPRVTDIEWITELNREGGWVILSADRRIAKNKAEQRVFRASKLIAFIFAPGLQKAPLLKKMERLMVMWGNIEKQVDLVGGGSMFEIQVKGTKLQPI